MVKGASIIMLFYFLGECLSFLINGIVPGSVCGMVLLFLSLLLKLVKPRDVRSVSNALTQNMALFLSLQELVLWHLSISFHAIGQHY